MALTACSVPSAPPMNNVVSLPMGLPMAAVDTTGRPPDTSLDNPRALDPVHEPVGATHVHRAVGRERRGREDATAGSKRPPDLRDARDGDGRPPVIAATGVQQAVAEHGEGDAG